MNTFTIYDPKNRVFLRDRVTGKFTRSECLAAPYFDAYHDTFVIYTFEGEDFVEYTFEREAVLVFDPEEQRIVNADIVNGDIE